MAISVAPESTATTTVPHDGSDLRKRPGAGASETREVSDYTSKTKDPDSDNSARESVMGSSSEDSIAGKSSEDDGIRSGATTECANSMTNGKDVGEKTADRGVQAMKYSYRPSAPAHLSIRESPLSSDAIFKQVGAAFVAAFHL
ncbi:Diacylglycerol O-acyltransferase 1 [Morella rubra]|uniref:Diacylglycerol O-acyltransferase 1 n=1 Tax=Morella rubra TaxID=262757 RepID=A0A6A1V957_9ROSI|nr:Diacylglycerol O-acyltransferase 1 [Morella rubra]KAB1209354.1 Diacylglycerol O-acyltransferase 1 [Morella rubra]